MKNSKFVGAGPVSAHTAKARQNKGITLIALVITIIVMLILVAVTISMAVNGGLFEYAGKATGDTQNEIDAEQQLANGKIKVGDTWYDSIDDYLNNIPSGTQGGGDETGGSGADIIGVDGEVFSAIYTKTKEYTDKNGDTAVIPKGFSVGKSDGINTIEDGLVIQDEEGNQFVWIPVTVTSTDTETSIAAFKRSAWEGNQRTDTLTTTSFPRSSYYKWSSFTEPYTSGYTGEDTEYKEMVKSVYQNYGFYIGRYEAGSQNAAGEPTPRYGSGDGTSKLVVKRDQYPYNYVGWGKSMSDYESILKIDFANCGVYSESGVDQGYGALYLSKAMYANEDVGVTSTLCYGIQWDAMLDFIKDANHNVTNSTSWGNYKDNAWTITRTTAKYSEDYGDTWTSVETSKSKTSSKSILLTTGADDSFAAKNIFDIAGNYFEWTNEALDSRKRSLRGRCVR